MRPHFSFLAGERRLIYRDPRQAQPLPEGLPRAANEQTLQGLEQEMGSIDAAVNEFAAIAINDAQNDAEALRLATDRVNQRYTELLDQKITVEKKEAATASKEALAELKATMPNLEIRQKQDNPQELQVVQFKKPGAQPVEMTEQQSSAIRETANKFAEGLKDTMKKFMPMIKELLQIFRDLQKQMKEFMEDMQFDNSTLATKDRLIDKQIANPETEEDLITQHKENTIRELKELDAAEDPNALQLKKDKVAELKNEKETELAKPERKAIEKDETTKKYDKLISAAQSEVDSIEAKLSKAKVRRPKLARRLRAINARLGLPAENGYTSVSAEPAEAVAATEPKPEVNTEEAAETQPEAAQESAEKTPLQQLISDKVDLINIDLVAGKSPSDVQVQVDELLKGVKEMAGENSENKAQVVEYLMGINFIVNTKAFTQPDPTKEVYTLDITSGDTVLHVLSYDAKNGIVEIVEPKKAEKTE